MTEARTYDFTVDALETVVDRCAADGDRIGYFAPMHLAVTNTVRQRAAEGGFEDAARIERFVTGFAGRYLDAEQAWQRAAPCAKRGGWRSGRPEAGVRSSCSTSCSA